MNITVFGTGYVGLVAGVCFADAGHHVICADIDKNKIEKLNKGTPTFFEPGLEDYLKKGLKKKTLTFTTQLEEAVYKSKIIFIAVGTPQDPNGKADLTYIFNVVGTIVDNANEEKTIIMKSTVPVGTHKKIEKLLKKSKFPLHYVSNPEFLREGKAVEDFLKPERVVLGGTHKASIETLKGLYKPFLSLDRPILTMTQASAEMAKYACNTYLATRISFINEMANLSERLGANIKDVKKVMTHDKRIGHRFLYPGVGYGGSCFPKDVSALIHTADESDCDLKILKATHQTNEAQKLILFYKVLKYFLGELKGKKITLWGISFKPHTDDIREAPSVVIIQKLLKEKAHVSTYDPIAQDNLKKDFGDCIEYANDPYEALHNSEALLILTEWNEFRTPDFSLMKEKMKNPALFDGRNIYERKTIEKCGFYYEGIGT
ncbi:MAG: UDP-glucose/GDP-mannose dehydrogenase family protein [Deltaproteobacteria bacterium]|nr:UDP-glucose/GDP-mannose dehydrogenase family protein [Deltaproteobacteria bacterium]